jgi:hypothetical protein
MSFETITSIEAAFAARAIDYSAKPDVSMIPERLRKPQLAHYDSMVVIEAINEGWVPDYNNFQQPKYEIWVEVVTKKDDEGNITGSGLALGDVGDWRTCTVAGARLAFESRAKAMHFWKHFQPLLEDLFLIR